MSAAVRRRRRDQRQARRRRAVRRPDRLGDRRLHPRRGRRRADVGAGDGGAAARHDRRRDGPLDGRDDRLRRAAGPVRGRCARPPTSTPPAASATRSPCRWPRWSPPAASPCRSCPGAGSATPAARSTSSRRSRAGARRCPTTSSLASSTTVGAVVCAAGDGLAPADRKLYALRDVTGTVESIPLIASSIMSKKIAEGSARWCSTSRSAPGAFMKDVDDARANWPRRWSRSGTAHGVRTVALLTDMSTPLGRTAGNALEVAESVEVLAGGGPRRRRRADPRPGPRDARRRRPGRRRPGRGAGRRPGDGRRGGAMIAAQGGDPRAPLPVAARDARRRGAAPRGADAPRRARRRRRGLAARCRPGRKEDPVSAGAGVVLLAKPGDTVRAGEPLLELHADEPPRFERALAALDGGIEIGDALARCRWSSTASRRSGSGEDLSRLSIEDPPRSGAVDSRTHDPVKFGTLSGCSGPIWRGRKAGPSRVPSC